MDYVSSLTSKGQVTIPAEIRKALGLKAKDKVAFRLKNGTVQLEPQGSVVMQRYGIAKLTRPLGDLKKARREMEEEVADRILLDMRKP